MPAAPHASTRRRTRRPGHDGAAAPQASVPLTARPVDPSLRPATARRKPSSRPPRPVRPPRTPKADSQGRILDAALAEFADRGFAGARVDRIAASARLNKAMLYYHFGSKERLYRTAIQRMLNHLAERLEGVAASNLAPPAKLDTYIDTFIRLGLSQPRFAPVMLREIAEGAARIDQDTVRHLLRVVATMRTIVNEGRREGLFRDVDPLLAYLTTVWPIMVYLAAGPIRRIIHRQLTVDTSGLDPEFFIRHMQDVSRRSLAAEPAVRRRRPSVPPTTERES